LLQWGVLPLFSLSSKIWLILLNTWNCLLRLSWTRIFLPRDRSSLDPAESFSQKCGNFFERLKTIFGNQFLPKARTSGLLRVNCSPSPKNWVQTTDTHIKVIFDYINITM
jgi:hypothetical protein